MSKKEIAKESGVGAIKGLIGAIPFAGTALNEAIFEVRGRLKQKRIEGFITNFSEFISQYSEEEIDITQIRNEDFSDFFEQLLFTIAKTRSKVKLKAFQNLLVNQLIQSSSIDLTELYTSVIDSLQEKQLLILNGFYENWTSSYVEFKGELIQKSKDLEQAELEFQWETQNRGYNEDYRADQKINKLENKISASKSEIERLKKSLNEESAPFSAKTYGCENYEFFYLLQDLASKGLLVDNGIKYNAEPFDLVEITQFGMDFIEFIKEKKPAANG